MGNVGEHGSAGADLGLWLHERAAELESVREQLETDSDANSAKAIGRFLDHVDRATSGWSGDPDLESVKQLMVEATLILTFSEAEHDSVETVRRRLDHCISELITECVRITIAGWGTLGSSSNSDDA